MRLTAELIEKSRSYYNPLKQRELDIRGLKIPVMENLGAAGDQFDVIDLSDNTIAKIENIPKFPRLKTLLLNNNVISQIVAGVGKNVIHCENLMYILRVDGLCMCLTTLTNNRLDSFKEIEKLGEWKSLTNLCLLGNPIESHDNFRVRVLSFLPNLKVLDFTKISDKERQEAAVLRESKEYSCLFALNALSIFLWHDLEDGRERAFKRVGIQEKRLFKRSGYSREAVIQKKPPFKEATIHQSVSTLSSKFK